MKTISTVLGPIAYDDQGDADRPAALLWPSLFSDHTMWDSQVAALRAAGWRTLALDPPGHAGSPGPNRLFTMTECTDVAEALLDTVSDGVPVVIFGTSWGGMIAPRLAARQPERVSGIILFNTTAETPDPPTRRTAKLLTWLLAIPPIDGLVNRMLLSLQLADGTRQRHPEICRNLAARFRSWRRRGLIQSVDSVLVRRDAFLDELPRVEVPALVVSGAEDTILPTPMSLRIVERMQNARHVEVAGAAHLVPLEQPDAANRLILDFVNGLAGVRR